MRMSKQCIIFLLLILSICYDESVAAESPCGDWETYKEEKCFKIIDETLRAYDDAEKICNQKENSATLVIIRSKEEQDFLSNLLFKNKKVIDNVWIGVKYTSNKFKWIDDSDLSFTNWASGSPQNGTGYDCVQMIPDDSSMGKWINEPCGRKNLVVCQKMQNWPISLLQKALLDTRKKLNDSLEVVTKQLKESQEDRKQLNNSLEDIRKNPVPIGFIYVQLPSQPDPKTLWSTVEWKDVTSDYAGLFFRAEGGDSAPFGFLQYENSPRLTTVKCGFNHWDYANNDSAELVTGEISKSFFTGRDNSGIERTLSFKISGGEVRPRNKAVRIWKRTN